MTFSRTLATRGRVDPRLLPKGPRGYPLCRWCRRECVPPRQTFCGDPCVHAHKLRSNPRYVRAKVFARDRGVCAVCRVDTEAIQRDLLSRDPKTRRALARRLGYPLTTVRKGSLWQADHIVPVALGGGECDLSNMQSLCLPCHARKSAAQRRLTHRRNRKA